MLIPSARKRVLSTLVAGVFAGTALLLPAGSASAQSAAPTSAQSSAQTPANECSATFHLGDRRFGPEILPKRGVVAAGLIGYRRTGSLSPQQFLDKYWDSAAAWWKYPPLDGYLLDRQGKPIIVPSKLRPGQLVDRYGSEFGQFLAPIGTPYTARAIPPQSLVSTPAGYCNYRAYKVLKPFTVDSGPIAPWFEQTGYGWQYVLKSSNIPGAPSPLTIKWLLENGYLQRVIGPPQTFAESLVPPLDRAPVS
ncbi:TNT domain-containing protein [Kribbella deserti]|uniref:TNT domain-containing protein n=1 Tax=Kribbella deserti TaxID=1926257 RepID=A0ABV6QL11_9ACTN